jgi:hypothetical protein
MVGIGQNDLSASLTQPTGIDAFYCALRADWHKRGHLNDPMRRREL